MVKRNRFLEQLRRREQAETPAEATTPEKPPKEMSAEELDVALLAAQRDLLDLRHQELRERELARVEGAHKGDAALATGTLAGVLRGLQRGKRRTWR